MRGLHGKKEKKRECESHGGERRRARPRGKRGKEKKVRKKKKTVVRV